MTIKLTANEGVDEVRMPRPLLEQAGLEGEVDLEIYEGRIVLRRPQPRHAREGWEASIVETQQLGLDDAEDFDDWRNASNVFDDEGWTW